jgi:hypothetical protein
MKFYRHTASAATLVFAAAAILGWISYNHYNPPDAALGASQAPTTPTETTSASATSTTETTTTSTSTTGTTWTIEATTVREAPPTTSSTAPTSSTTSTSSTLKAGPSYLDRYSGKGFRQVSMHIRYFCPTCVQAVAQTVQKEPGIMGKSMGWGQKVSWIIYDPKVVDLERVLELAASSGGVDYFNDTAV